MSLSATGILVILFGLSFTTYDCEGILRLASVRAFEDKCDANRENCEDTDVCSKCHENARCIYINGHYECQCTIGYTGNGVSCTDFDECSELGNENARCVNTEGSYELHCKTGYVLAGNGRSCILDRCHNITCKEPMTRCVNDEHDPKKHHCRCPSNRIGETCEFPGPCSSIITPCVHGKCFQVNDVGKYRCDCFPGYVGFFCEFDDPCLSKPCHHGGKCQPDNNTGKCTCDCTKTGYVGPTCSDTDKCTTSPCLNGGFCTTDSIGNILCICKSGFTGDRCQTAVTKCTDKTCNEGKCDEHDGKVKCSCGKKQTGEYCETNVTCDDHPCENGGVCKDDSGSYTCWCDAGYSGSNCEIIELPCEQDIFTNLKDECVPNPCGKSQMCWTDEDGSATCLCQPGDFGEGCLSNVSSCKDVVCLHDGKCINEDGKFKCNCSAEYKGSNCQNKANGEILRPPEMSYFCPVVQTIGEQAGCKKCFAGVENCKGCCSKEEQSCIANCQHMDQFCKSCTEGALNYEQCKEVKTKCEGSSLVNCTSLCTREAKKCSNSCTDTGSAAEECPKVYLCPKAKEQIIRHKGSVSGVQCRALKYASGKIECAYKKVTAKKEEYQSYIMFPRINFAGKLQIDSATLNNVFSNFDIKTFAPEDTKVTDENWNPMGSSDFRLVDVSVTRVCHTESLCVYQPHEDPLAGAPIQDQANGKVSAKIVDLDIEVQGRLSEIYGLSINVGGYFKGDMERASFQSLWYKMIDVPNDDYGQGSRLQSVLNNVQFSAKKNDSSIVQHFRENIGPNQKLSICFNVDMMAEHPAANYSYARIVGSIGLAGEKAPYFFDHGRLLHHLQATKELSYAPFTVDEQKKKIYIDLGNTLAIDRHGDVLVSVGQLALGVYAGEVADGVETPNCLDKITWISRIYYNEYGGYHFTAGINKIDIPSHLKGSLDKQFVLAKINEDGSCLNIFLAENKKGINVRSNSRFIFRAEYDEIVQGSLFVTIFGKKPSHTHINLRLETADSIIRDHPLGPEQPFGLFRDSKDASIYRYYFYAMNNPNNIRKIIDGQVYALQYTFDGYPLNPDRNEAMNTAICIHVYDQFVVNDRPKWLPNILPIFQLYANLYPVMRSFLDLAAYNGVVKKKCHIITAMSLDFQDPQFMPVTRDLSSGKTKMVLKWLDFDKPEFGFTHAEQLTKQHLLDLLQTALQLEHSTIPVYLNGFLSIKPFQNDEVKEMIHQIIVDEMFHLAQVANIINGLGGRPYLLGKTFVPAFPSHLPGGCRPNMIASINKISYQQINNVYMEIEEPSYVLKDHELVALINKISKAKLQSLTVSSEEGGYQGQCAEALGFFPLPNKKLTEKNHETIGDLYMALVYILGQLSICGEKDIFTGKTRQLKWSNPKNLREVRNYTDALEAIKAIVDQGEGASPYNPLQQNVDSSELSHYFKFSSIYHGRHITTFNVTNEKVYANNEEECHENYVYLGDKIPFFETGVWPVVNDPEMSKYKPDSQAYKNAQAFNDIYRRLLETLQSVFDGNVDRFDDTFGLMKSLIVYGSRVVQTPIDDDGDPNIGPNAGPTYFN